MLGYQNKLLRKPSATTRRSEQALGKPSWQAWRRGGRKLIFQCQVTSAFEMQVKRLERWCAKDSR